MGKADSMRELITNSRATSFKRCRRRHWFEYEQGIRPAEEGKALRMGSAVHAGLDILKKGGSLETAHDAAAVSYVNRPDGADSLEFDYEQMTVLCLISGWDWRWGENGGMEVLMSEESFEIPLLNPATNAPSTKFNLAGKTDGIIAVDGRQLVLEHKTVSEDLSESSGYWQRLQMDGQISLYVHAARQLGMTNVSGVMYDVIRKPSIRPEAVPLLDENGIKIVLDANGQRVMTADGKKPRQTGSTADGYVLQTRPMEPNEWARKLANDIGARPDFYFARREIARLDGEIRESLDELWDLQKTLAEAKLRSRWYRTVSRDTCPYCPFFSLCSSKTDVTVNVPDGFVRVDNVHQEL
jgi:hypothetical protein